MTLIYYSTIIPKVYGAQGHAGFLVSTVGTMGMTALKSTLSSNSRAPQALGCSAPKRIRQVTHGLIRSMETSLDSCLPKGSKDPKNRVLGPKYHYKCYLGPKTLLFGSLDP